MTCEWCAINAGRTHANRPCCQLRDLAMSPRHVQAAYAATLTEEGRDELRPRLKVEIARLKELRMALRISQTGRHD